MNIVIQHTFGDRPSTPPELALHRIPHEPLSKLLVGNLSTDPNCTPAIASSELPREAWTDTQRREVEEGKGLSATLDQLVRATGSSGSLEEAGDRFAITTESATKIQNEASLDTKLRDLSLARSELDTLYLISDKGSVISECTSMRSLYYRLRGHGGLLLPAEGENKVEVSTTAMSICQSETSDVKMFETSLPTLPEPPHEYRVDRTLTDWPVLDGTTPIPLFVSDRESEYVPWNLGMVGNQRDGVLLASLSQVLDQFGVTDEGEYDRSRPGRTPTHV